MRLLATADIHISKKEDCAVLARILQAVKDTDCAALLIGGDLLEEPFVGPEVENTILALLSAATFPIFIAAGNHDPLALTPFYRNLPAGVHVFPTEITCYTLAEGVHLYGYSANREVSDDHPLRGFTATGSGVRILLGHGQAEGGAGKFRPISREELANSGLHLAILGHIHKGEQRQIGGCRLLVPGIPQGRGWDELGEKQVHILETDGQTVTVTPYRVADICYMEYTVDLSDCRDTGEMLAAMEAVEAPSHVVFRLVLVGSVEQSPLPAVQAYTERTGREVKDMTDSFGSIEVLKAQNTLQGAFVRKAMAALEQATPEERPLLERALRLGLQALKEARI